MKWLIKNPAPSDSRREKWGDFHVGRSLTRYLERAGHTVATQYDPGWDVDEPADVVLVLRGKYPFPPTVSHGGAMRVMWNLSHPADVDDDEYATYDLVCIASRPWAKAVADRVDVPVRPLLQATDVEEFQPAAADGAEREGVVFIGNTRDVSRPSVLWALEYGLPLRIWGRGWDDFGVGPDRIVADYVRNEELGALYASSRATLNDHWPDMREYGFVNNRVFDALACGLPVVSDWHDELVSLVPEGVLSFRDQQEFDLCMQAVLLDGPRLEAGAAEVGSYVRSEFSYQKRTMELLALVDEMAGGR